MKLLSSEDRLMVVTDTNDEGIDLRIRLSREHIRSDIYSYPGEQDHPTMHTVREYLSGIGGIGQKCYLAIDMLHKNTLMKILNSLPEHFLLCEVDKNYILR